MACGEQKNAYDPSKRVDGGPVKVVGVSPDRFDCKAFLPDVDKVVGAPVTWIESEFAPQAGTAPPCTFARSDDETKSFQLSLDCRKVAEGEVDFLIKSKKKQAEDEAALYAKDPKTFDLPTGKDGGPPPGPLAAKDVPIGKRGLDHSNAQLVFIDDDTSCGVYVVGPDEASRLALAQAIAQRLTNDNAPRYPRGKPVK